MRLWHQELIDKLPRQQLLGQHRECCALRGKGWGKKHSIVNYVFEYPPVKLYNYHEKVMLEMLVRGYNPNERWFDITYRGKNCEPWSADAKTINWTKECHVSNFDDIVYPEHNQEYLDECVSNLADKGCVCRYFEDEFEQYLNNI